MYGVNRARVLPGLLLGTALCLAAPVSASTYKQLYNFTGFSLSDGSQPSGELVADKSGRLYGTTALGGAHGGGTLFRLTKTGNKWTEEVLFNFSDAPQGGVVIGDSGELYGVSKLGGNIESSGTVWRFGTDGQLTILHTFSPFAGEGFYPEAGLVMGKDGMLYGTTTGQPPQDGSVPGPNPIYGTVFRVSPDGDPAKFATLHVFGGGTDGQFPQHGRLLADAKGVLTGTAMQGGRNSDGMVYQLVPPKQGKTVWTEKVLHDFPASGTQDAIAPISGVVRGPDGIFYGCAGGGTHGEGAIYALNTKGIEKVFYNFGDQANDPVAAPSCAVIIDAAGVVYGTSTKGGASDKGTLFKLEPPVDSLDWTMTVLHSFGAGDGENPAFAPLQRGKMFYGTTVLGGASGGGMAFSLKP